MKIEAQMSGQGSAAPPQDIARNRELAVIHIHKRALGLDDDVYRDFLKGITEKTSAKDMDKNERLTVIRTMENLLGRKSARDYKRPGVGRDREPLMRKIGALLADSKRPWRYAHGIAQQMFGVDFVQWCDKAQLRAIVAALVKDAKRRADKAVEAGEGAE